MCDSIIPSHSVQLTYSSDELFPPKKLVGRNCLVICRDLVRAGARSAAEQLLLLSVASWKHLRASVNMLKN